MPVIDYARMQKVYPKQKSALTRAMKKGYPAVVSACIAAVQEWDSIGAWPDGWSSWQRALDDAALQAHVTPPMLEELLRKMPQGE